MIRQLQKAFRAGSRLKPLHCGKILQGAVPICNPMPEAHFQLPEVPFQFVILRAEGEGM
jgi:hypothetical protein